MAHIFFESFNIANYFKYSKIIPRDISVTVKVEENLQEATASMTKATFLEQY